MFQFSAFYVYSQNWATIVAINFRLFHHLKEKPYMF